MFRVTASLTLACLAACAPAPPPEKSVENVEPVIPTIEAELLASDGSWGNTEGPAIDSSGALYFTSRGTYKGIIRWTEADGPQQYAPVANMAGPGGLWIDAADNIFLTATDEREVQKLAPSGDVTSVAKEFELKPDLAKGPNDIVVSSAGIVYFTDPKGYRGEADPGSVFWIDAEGETTLFDDTVVGPNGIVLSQDERTLYVAHNFAEDKAHLVSWPLNEDGSRAGDHKILADIEPCVGDGMAVNANGNVWVTCYSYGTAHLIDPSTGATLERITTEQKALTNAVFGRGSDNHTLYLSSSDMDRVTGYVYKATVATPGLR